MEKEVARRVLQHVAVASENLNTSVHVVLDSCPEGEFLKYREEVAKIMGEMFFNLMAPIYKSHPDLVPEQLKMARQSTENPSK